MNKKPDSVDEHIAVSVRMLRRARGLTQTELAKTLGISYQQMQKYEAAKSRLPASYLYAIATRLGVPVWSFFPPPPKRRPSAFPAQAGIWPGEQ